MTHIDVAPPPAERYPEPLNASASTSIRQGQRAGIARGEYQVVTQRAEGTNKRTMWVRFVGATELRAVPEPIGATA